jgi:hypothetical protein
MFSVDSARISVAGFGRRLFWACIGGIPVNFVRKICGFRSITGGKVGSGRGLGDGTGRGELAGAQSYIASFIIVNICSKI